MTVDEDAEPTDDVVDPDYWRMAVMPFAADDLILRTITIPAAFTAEMQTRLEEYLPGARAIICRLMMMQDYVRGSAN